MTTASAAQGISPHPDTGTELCFLLGTDYEKKKNQLQQELQEDYKHYVSTKKDLKTSEPHPLTRALSLPIDDKISVREKLREERNKEYNLFLHKQAETRKLKRASSPITSEAAEALCISPPASHLPFLNTHANTVPAPSERPVSRRDAATVTEVLDGVKRTGSWEPARHRRRRRWRIIDVKEPHSSDEELMADREEDMEVALRKEENRRVSEPDSKEERPTRRTRANRVPQGTKDTEAPGVRDENNNDSDSDPPVPDDMRSAARPRPASSKEKAGFATGLLIGAEEEHSASQLRKEQYRQELLEQIAQQRKNRMREKKLELRVAATGATDPEKEPDRIKQFGAVNRQHDTWRRDVPYKQGTDLKAAGRDANPRSEDDKPAKDAEQRGTPGNSHPEQASPPGPAGKTALDLPNMLSEVVLPRLAEVPPPVAPTVTNEYKTPYDAAYYYYGTRNPLDPNHPHNGPPEGAQQTGNFHSPPQRPPSGRRSDRTEPAESGSSPLDGGEFPADKAKQRRERTLSYQEALREQIKNREECKRREKEEKERYDAKIEAEMLAYKPWGRSGGGAPIKDQKGNLVSDLNQMHRFNLESYRNPALMTSGQTQSPLERNAGAGEAGPTGLYDNSEQQILKQDRYKEELKRQIEANRRKKQEEREQMKAKEEELEKTLAAQRARMQREYEEEQRRQKAKMERRLESWVQETNTQHRAEERRQRQEEETQRKVAESASDREERGERLSYEREPSPPVPALRRKLTNPVASRPPSVVSSSRTERSVSAPHHRASPQLQDGQREVIRELSALRRYLRTEQRRLETQLGQTDRQESFHNPPRSLVSRPLSRPRGRVRGDDEPAERSPSSGPGRDHMRHIREFKQLKSRDTASRRELRLTHPDPPTDPQSLDIQQQALLRQQERIIRLMKREGEEDDFMDLQLSRYNSRNKPGRHIHRDSMLPSETAFLDVYSVDGSRDGDAAGACEQSGLQQAAEQRERRQRSHEAASLNRSNADSELKAQSVRPATSSTSGSRVRAQNQQQVGAGGSGDHGSTGDDLPGDDLDVSSLSSALERRVSVETVATEPWLRPGTSDAAKRSGCRETSSTPPWLTHRVK